MSLESPSAPAAADPSVSSIENEIPTYRAISRLALASLVLGLATVFSFASPWFALAGLGAVLCGLVADARIRRYSDALTGRGFAQAGIALGMIFALSALTITAVRGTIVQRSAARWARAYEKVLQTGTMADVAYLRFDSASRKDKTPEEMLTGIVQNSTDPTMIEVYLGPLRSILNRLTRDNATVHFVEIERSGYERLTPWATAVYEIDGPGSEGKPTHEFFLLELKSAESGPLDWHIENVAYPYTRRTHVRKDGPVDDGHGH